MSTRLTVALAVALFAIVGLFAWIWYPSLPDTMPTHWNINGQVDGWMPKAQSLQFGFGLLVFLLAILLSAQWLSPKGFDIEPFRPTFNYVVLLVLALFAFIQLASLQFALHPGLPSGRILISGMMLFFGLLGNVMGKIRRNFYMGIRTPWTLASDAVWVATHRLAARIMVVAGLGCALATAVGVPIAPVFAVMMASILYPVVYSFVLSKRLEKEVQP